MNLVEHIDGMVPFPEGVYREDIKTDDVTIHTRIGGRGPAVVMLHGFGTTGDMWAPVASALAENVEEAIVPDSGHWITEENPSATTKLVIDFLNV